jgi:acetylornithine deacetylase
MDIMQQKVKSELKARNLTNKSSATPTDHLLMQTIHRLGTETYTSPTTSDWMRITCPAIKMGVGDSARSHQADEFVLISELEDGVKRYIKFVEMIGA